MEAHEKSSSLSDNPNLNSDKNKPSKKPKPTKNHSDMLEPNGKLTSIALACENSLDPHHWKSFKVEKITARVKCT